MRPGPPRYYNLAIVEPGTPFPPPRNGDPAFLLPLFAPVPVAAVVAQCNLARLQPKAALCIGPNAPGSTGRIWGRHPESRGSQNGRGPRRQNHRLWDSWGPVANDAYTFGGLAVRGTRTLCSRAHARVLGGRIVATDRPLLSEGEGRYFRPDFGRFAVMDGAPGAHVGYAVQEEGRVSYLSLGPDSGLLSDRAALPTPSQRGLLRLASAAGRDALL